MTRARLRSARRRALLVLALSFVGLTALVAGQFALAYWLLDARALREEVILAGADGGAGLLIFLVVAVALRRLTRERRHHALIEALVAALSVPQSIEVTAEVTLNTLLGARVARAGIVGVLSGEEGAQRIVPLAVSGARRGWSAEPLASGGATGTPFVHRERVTEDPWLLGLEVNVGRRPWVARIPVERADEQLGLLLLASRRRGWLRDRALLQTVGTLLAAALDHGRQYQFAYERTRELEEQNARRREFLYAIAHELRSPLTSIQAFAELLGAERRLGEDSDLLLSSLSRGVDRLATFVNDLLDLGRVEETQLRVQVTPIDITGALRGAETMLRPSFMAREQALAIDLPEAPLYVLGDDRALEQVMLNLLSNANRFTPTGGAVRVRGAAMGDRVRIEVHDSGPGIDPLDRERIFEPFYRVHRNGAFEVPGSGLGLAVARRLTELQGGRIWVEAGQPYGSCFCIELVAADEPRLGPEESKSAIGASMGSDT